MSEIPVPVLLIVLLFGGAWLLMTSVMRRQARQRALPWREEYLVAQGQQAPACQACGSTRLTDTGLSCNADEVRLVSCADCRKDLFRQRRPADEGLAA
ncbi:MAG: hypothetical protein RBS40_11655 [Rhodocyclaceae bacterium]|jgi:hypothetical protein|nr:hypothetical protein [Rhodocyclaceae bacterium]